MSARRSQAQPEAANSTNRRGLKLSLKDSSSPKRSKWLLIQRLCRFTLALLTLLWTVQVSAQNAGYDPKLATLIGTVTDTNDGVVAGATVVLVAPDSTGQRKLVTGENGFFQFTGVSPETAYQVNVSASGFSDWTSPLLSLAPGEFRIVQHIQLRIATNHTTLNVTYTPAEVAADQVKIEETQRVFGVIPNFYVVYDKDPAPLTPDLKFKLAMKVARDPATIGGVVFLSGIYQATDHPKYGEGAQGYAKRVGTIAADGFADIMVGGAILPSLLHQDPRYFYQGTGTTRSRLFHAISAPFVARGDNGKSQPNYSSVGGDLASSALANAYYPDANRGLGPFLTAIGIATAQRVGASIAQEFIFGRFGRHREQ